jgi:chain length determinant protein (polysaccharide antigen chain regulator)
MSKKKNKRLHMLNNRTDVQDTGEIDLIALVRGLWAQKWLIIGVTLLVTLGAGAYAFLSKPLYEAKLFMLPPTQNGIADFNYGRGKDADLDFYTVKDVYAVFVRNLQAESLRQAFFNDVYLPSLPEAERKGSQDRLYQSFSRQLVVGAPGRENPDRYSVTVQSIDSAQTAGWVKAYVQRASEAAKSEMIKNVTREASVRARNLEQQIVGLRESAQRMREDRILQLREALKIAETIGLTAPHVTSNASLDISVEVDEKLAYRRGSKALAAEVKTLESRTSDDAFITDLRPLQMKYNFYSRLNVDPASISVYRQDGSVEVPDSPIKPRKALILALGVVVGLMLGGIIALIRLVLNRGSEQEATTVR